MKVFRVLLDVNIQRNEVLVDERRDLRILVRLGFQPSTCYSGRCGAEIDEQRFILFFGLTYSFVGIFDPVYGHKKIASCPTMIAKSQEAIVWKRPNQCIGEKLFAA